MMRRWLVLGAIAGSALALAVVMAGGPAGLVRAQPGPGTMPGPGMGPGRGPGMGMGPGMMGGQGAPMQANLQQLTGDDFDRAFLQQMSMHHQMALMMAAPVVQNAEHQELKGFAATMIADQSREIAQMRAWLSDWYGVDLPAMMGSTPGGPGAGMGMSGPMMSGGAGMGGGMMMSMQDMGMMGHFWSLPAPRLEAVFLSMMIPHHQDAIDMAQLALDRSEHEEVKDLARAIIASQSAEMTQMRVWLADWYNL